MGLGGSIKATIELMYRASVGGLKKDTQNLRKLDKAAKSTRESFANLAGAFTGLFAARMVKQGFEALLKPTLEMEEAMTRLAMITTLGTKGLDRFRKKAFEVAGMTPFGPQEITGALLELQRATGDTEAAFAGLQSTATLSMVSMGKLPLERTAKMMGELARTFGFGKGEIGKKSAMIFAAAKASGVGLENYEKVMGRLGLAALRAGQSYENMLVAFSMTKRIIPSAQRASQQMMRFMGELTKPKAVEAFKRIGIDIKDSTGKMKSLQVIMSQLSAAQKKIGDVAIMEALTGDKAIGERSIKPLLAMLTTMERGIPGLGKGAEAWSNLRREMEGSEAMMKRARDQFLAMHGASIKLLKEALVKIAITLGDTLLPALGTMAKMLKWVVEGIDGLVKASPLLTKFAGAAMIFAVFTAGLWAFRAALLGATQLMDVVSANLLKASASAVRYSSSMMIASKTTNVFTSATRQVNGQLMAMPTRMQMVGAKARGMFSSVASGARGLVKPLAAVIALMELLEFMSGPGAKLDKWSIWLMEAQDTWADMMSEADSVLGKLLGRTPGKIHKENAKDLSKAYRKEFEQSSIWGDMHPAELAAMVVPVFGQAWVGYRMLISDDKKNKAKDIMRRNLLYKEEKRAKERQAQVEKENQQRLLSTFRFGSNALGEVADKLKTAMGYKPKVADFRKLAGLQTGLRVTAARAKDPAIQAAATNALAMSQTLEALALKAVTGKGTQEEYARSLIILRRVINVSAKLAALRGKGTGIAVTGGQVEGVRTKFAPGVQAPGTAAGRLADKDWDVVTGGRYTGGRRAGAGYKQWLGGGREPTGGEAVGLQDVQALFPEASRQAAWQKERAQLEARQRENMAKRKSETKRSDFFYQFSQREGFKELHKGSVEEIKRLAEEGKKIMAEIRMHELARKGGVQDVRIVSGAPAINNPTGPG